MSRYFFESVERPGVINIFGVAGVTKVSHSCCTNEMTNNGIKLQAGTFRLDSRSRTEVVQQTK